MYEKDFIIVLIGFSIILTIIGVMIMLKPIKTIINDSIGNIMFKGNVVTGIVAADNGNKSYDVFIDESEVAYPGIFTLSKDPDLAVGDKVRILYKNGDRNNPIILLTTGILPIDIGSPAISIDNDNYYSSTYTKILANNPANNSGIITNIEIWSGASLPLMTGLKVATFKQVSANTFTATDSCVIGSVPFFSKNIYTVELNVLAGDYIGLYYASGYMGRLVAGPGCWVSSIPGDQTACVNLAFEFTANRDTSLYGSN